ncbi:MAG TPA: DUF4097 family beta strand repeat-containing protein [Gemmatimonadales bacterium]|jgi:DUF4097 and DUF4098 domain-containing protein YvlB|nr:DUF4097 family beta strand repeat-containing protein [Gemmatimonadales bacterium]
MFATLAAAMLVTLAPQRQTDTTIAVPAGASLSVNNFGGGITVHGWSENRVKVHGETGRRGRVEVSLVGNTVVVKTGSREGAPSVIDLDITVPASMSLTLSGTYADINVDGVQGPISAETVDGEVNVRGGKGNITLHSIQGSVTLADASGRIEVNSVNEDVELTNVSGEIKVETTNGEIMLTGVQSASVDAGTINGDVLYEGTVTDGGSYSFGSHNGDITVSIPERANVTITAATANGDIDASFPLPMNPGPTGKHRKTFKIGSGSARMELESFQGDIELRRPQELQDRVDRKHKHDENENENDNEGDWGFNFHFDSRSVASYAARYAAEYAPRYAAEYAPRYARTYARAYSRAYARTH